MSIKTVGVIGAGTMGTGIAQACATSGLNVILRDIDMKYVDGSLDRMEKSLHRAIEKGRMTTEEKDATLGRITKTVSLAEFAQADVVIEAVLEDLDLKQSIFAELNTICHQDTIFATNTSSLSITSIAAGSGRPDHFCGIHFFNPVSVMKLIEIISGLNTADDTIKKAYELANTLGKTPVHVKKDSPGFIVNKLLVPYMNEAVKLLAEGVASAEDIDTAVRLGLNYPMGPFQMLDMGGIDLSITILDYFQAEYGNPHYAPQLLLRQMSRGGQTGRKSGGGFYKYD